MLLAITGYQSSVYQTYESLCSDECHQLPVTNVSNSNCRFVKFALFYQPMKRIFQPPWSIILFVILFSGGAWLLGTDHPTVWPVRNLLQYYLARQWWNVVGPPPVGEPGTLRGLVRDEQGRPIAQAWILVSRWDGTTYHTRSDAEGRYALQNVPAGRYRPVAGAPGYQSIVLVKGWNTIEVRPHDETILEVRLPVEATSPVSPGENFFLAEPRQLGCEKPLKSQAIRRQVHFVGDEQPNQLTFYYTPVTVTVTSRLPILLIIYPGPADTWECVSAPLAAAGYGLIAVGPAYTFELEQDLDELARLLMFAREGRFPNGDGRRLALLGGSYSSLHILRLLQRGETVDGAVLMGPPTDLFDMRRRLEDGSFIPPFGLDYAFRMLGFPSQVPLRYWRYSGAYHVEPDFPPILLFHSYTDEVVPYQQGELLATQLEAAGVPHESYFFEGGGHYLLAEDGDADVLEMYRITLDFLARRMNNE